MTNANKSILSDWPRIPFDKELFCNLCGLKITRTPMFRVTNAHTKYYHVECAKKVNHI